MKTDKLRPILKAIDHNRYTVIGIVIAIALAATIVGCQVRTASTITPGAKVTADELSREIVVAEADFTKRRATIETVVADLNADIEAHNALVTAAESDLQKQTQARASLIELAGSLGTAAIGGPLSPATLLAAVLQGTTIIGGIGLLADNRRKNSVIEDRKSSDPSNTPQA